MKKIQTDLATQIWWVTKSKVMRYHLYAVFPLEFQFPLESLAQKDSKSKKEFLEEDSLEEFLGKKDSLEVFLDLKLNFSSLDFLN